MKIIAGLGNPGAKYETTRHNAGFLAVDRLVDRWRATGPTTKFHAEIYQARVDGESVMMIKPKTYMNLSGQSIGAIMDFYHCTPKDLIVIHDELALPPMVMRLKAGGGAGGHNGLKSIDAHLGKNNEYFRIRIGVGHPSMSEQTARISPADYVLSPFQDSELKALDSLLDQVAEAAEFILRGEIQTAMNKFHRS